LRRIEASSARDLHGRDCRCYRPPAPPVAENRHRERLRRSLPDRQVRSGLEHL